jgi:hypothetical protein
LQPPSKGRWCIAECYSHLINYGELYFDNIEAGVANGKTGKFDLRQSFPPRWLWKKAIHFFEPPYKIKLKTFDSMKPDPVMGYNKTELLKQYIDLQDRFLEQLEEAQHKQVDLGRTKIEHPMIALLKMTLSESFALTEAHQRRHQWQAEQTLNILQG